MLFSRYVSPYSNSVTPTKQHYALEYLGSVSLVKVDWARMASRFENLFYTTDALGGRKPPTVRSIWKWMVDFLTADFQPRASFVAGFALGLRVG